MKIISIAVSSIGALLMLYTLVCGLWIHSHGPTPEEIAYHGRYGITSIAVLLLGLGLLVYQLVKG
ncbi:MAG TPA: hypothetical protein VFF68_11050 [Anaerolineaceae bacterium]|nr:hypothetical protein [Anaerolineaceae bacterium]